jgi:hypothetical protein
MDLRFQLLSPRRVLLLFLSGSSKPRLRFVQRQLNHGAELPRRTRRRVCPRAFDRVNDWSGLRGVARDHAPEKTPHRIDTPDYQGTTD